MISAAPAHIADSSSEGVSHDGHSHDGHSSAAGRSLSDDSSIAVQYPNGGGLIASFDDTVDRLLDNLRGHEPYDRVFYALSELGDFGLIWHLAAWVKALGPNDGLRHALETSGVLAIESVVVNGAIKSLFKRERPVIQGPRPHRLRVPLTTSFPSGHASAATVAAMLLGERSRVPAAWWALALAIASSRAYVRIHHASDVVGGVAVGLVIGSVARAGLRRINR